MLKTSPGHRWVLQQAAAPAEVRGWYSQAAAWRRMRQLPGQPLHSQCTFGWGPNSGDILHIFKQMLLLMIDVGTGAAAGGLSLRILGLAPARTSCGFVPLLYCRRVSSFSLSSLQFLNHFPPPQHRIPLYLESSWCFLVAGDSFFSLESSLWPDLCFPYSPPPTREQKLLISFLVGAWAGPLHTPHTPESHTLTSTSHSCTGRDTRLLQLA